MMKGLNREQRRNIKNLNKDQLITWLTTYAIDCYSDGLRDALMCLLLKLHDEFDFGNDEVDRLLKASQPWLKACVRREEDIDSDGIRQQLIQEGIVCLENYKGVLNNETNGKPN